MKNIISFLLYKYNAILFVVLLSLSFSSCKTATKGSSLATKKGEISDKDKKKNFDYLFYNANKEKIMNNYDLAETYFTQALKIEPNNAATLYELAYIYSHQKDKTKAIEFSKKAANIDPDNIWYQLLYADCLKQNKQTAEVAKVYEKIVKSNPDKIDYYYDLANAYLYLNKPTDALKVYAQMENRFGVTEEICMSRLSIYKTMNNFDKALEEVQKLIKTFPKEAKYYGILGELYQSKGENQKALQAYNDLLKIDPANAFVHLSLADYYRNQKQNDQAYHEIKIAFESKELDIDTKIKILLSYYDITDKYPELKPDADTLCEILVAVHPDEAKAFAMYGDFLIRDKKLQEARIQYGKAIALDKDKFALWDQLLRIDSELNDFTAIEKESKEAIELFPNQPLPYFYNGGANIRLKKYQEAVDVLTEGKEFVLNSKPVLSQFYMLIGDAQNYLNNHETSDLAYDKSLDADPNNATVLNNYAYYLSLRKINLEKAAAMSKKSNELEPNNNAFQDTYGWILFLSKKYDDAKIWVGKALDNGGRGSGTLLEHYGDVLFKLGDVDNALKYWLDAKKAGGTSDLIDKKIADKKLYE